MTGVGLRTALSARPCVAAFVLAALAAGVAGCSAPRSRPVEALPHANPALLSRLSAVDDQPGTPVLALLASPEDAKRGQSGEGAPGEGASGQGASGQGASGQGASGQGPNDVDADGGPRAVLTFDDVMRSVEARFPLILAALETLEIAAAEQLSARGGFDTRLKAGGEVAAEGFYETDRAKAVLEQPTTAWGTTLFTGYKFGSGNFPDWEGGDKTQTDGEFSAGVRLPLLRGREIDAARLALWRSQLARAAAEPIVLAKRLEATRKAASTYWKWVAAGQKRALAQRVLDLAEGRQAIVSDFVTEGKLADIALAENRRFVVEREAILVATERELERASIALSLFWRDAEGNPVLPTPEALPEALPEPLDPILVLRSDDVDVGRRHRPELQALQVELERLDLDRRKARNDLLPRLDVSVAGSQDIGEPTTTPDDKGPFELDAWITLDLPIQRRTAFGKADELDAKRRKLRHELRLAQDSVAVEIEDSRSAVRRSWEQLARRRENVTLAGRLERVERILFAEGQSDLFRVNLREQQTASAASTYIDLVAEHFRALAEYRASLGVPYDEVR